PASSPVGATAGVGASSPQPAVAIPRTPRRLPAGPDDERGRRRDGGDRPGRLGLLLGAGGAGQGQGGPVPPADHGTARSGRPGARPPPRSGRFPSNDRLRRGSRPSHPGLVRGPPVHHVAPVPAGLPSPGAV